MTMKLSMIVAVSENGVIGSSLDIPWKVKGEQLLSKALTYNQWSLVGRKTFDSMGELPNRKYAVVSRGKHDSNDSDFCFLLNINEALEELGNIAGHVFVSGSREIYRA